MTVAEWLTPEMVKAFLDDKTPTGDVDDRPALTQATEATAVWVQGLHPAYLDEFGETYDPPADIKLGAVMFAGRLYQRRGTLMGVAGFSDFGGSPILRQDPDIARLLRIGQHAAFIFGAPSSETTP